jgi:hypothetical protein
MGTKVFTPSRQRSFYVKTIKNIYSFSILYSPKQVEREDGLQKI